MSCPYLSSAAKSANEIERKRMSSAITVGSPGAGDSPTRRRGARLVVTLVILIIAIGTMLAGASPAHAGSHGVGYDIGEGWLGSYSTDSDGRQAYCIDLGMNAPFSPTSGPQTITSLDSLSRQQIAELNYVLARWGQSGDPNVTAAVALYVWSGRIVCAKPGSPPTPTKRRTPPPIAWTAWLPAWKPPRPRSSRPCDTKPRASGLPRTARSEGDPARKHPRSGNPASRP